MTVMRTLSPRIVRATWISTTLFVFAGSGTFFGGCTREKEIPPGCASGNEISAPMRKEILDAADVLYRRMAAGQWQEVYESAAGAVREQRTADEFLTPMARVAQRIGLPREPTVHYMSVVRFGDDFPYRLEVECDVKGADGPAILLLANYPVQATLVHKAFVGGEAFYFSTLWQRDAELWKLAGFFAKPATWAGKDWEDYEKEATAQRLAKNVRNSALLYNVAIDLVVPNVWVKPPEVEGLERKQGRLSVADLPIGQPVSWAAGPDTFKVFRVAYELVPNQLGLSFRYQGGAFADTTAQAASADRLYTYICDNFPEYSEVFSTYFLVAQDPAEPEKVVRRNYPAPGTGK